MNLVCAFFRFLGTWGEGGRGVEARLREGESKNERGGNHVSAIFDLIGLYCCDRCKYAFGIIPKCFGEECL